MAKKIGVLLSGCGVFDGAEIHEAVLTLLFWIERGHRRCAWLQMWINCMSSTI
jgi:enhancing lycopene biosynthesis protein 2